MRREESRKSCPESRTQGEGSWRCEKDLLTDGPTTSVGLLFRFIYYLRLTANSIPSSHRPTSLATCLTKRTPTPQAPQRRPRDRNWRPCQSPRPRSRFHSPSSSRLNQRSWWLSRSPTPSIPSQTHWPPPPSSAPLQSRHTRRNPDSARLGRCSVRSGQYCGRALNTWNIHQTYLNANRLQRGSLARHHRRRRRTFISKERIQRHAHGRDVGVRDAERRRC